MSASAESETTQPLRVQPKLFGEHIDWLLVIAAASLLPWLWLWGSDFWCRTDYRFFPILMLVPLVLVVRWGKLQGAAGRERWWSSLVLWLASGVSAIAAAWLFSPWFGLLGLVLAWMAWSLLRLAGRDWTQVISWSLPALALLALPLSDASDPVYAFAVAVTGASSSLLDLFRIPQLPDGGMLELRAGRLDVAAVCRGLGNPYLLAGAALLLCLVRRPSGLVCLLTVASVPLWAWGGDVLLVTLGSILAETWDVHILFGYRLWLVQAVMFVALVASIAAFQQGLEKLVAPFVAHSEGVGGWHKLFNRVVLWPAPDPLRKRKKREGSGEASGDPQSAEPPRTQWLLGGAAMLLVVGGGWGYFRLLSGRVPGNVPLASVLRGGSLAAGPTEHEMIAQALPEQWQGMRLLSFELLPRAAGAAGGGLTARWTYAYQQRTVLLTMAFPYRGFYPRERAWTVGAGEVVEGRRRMEISQADADPARLVDEVVVRDPVAGPAYLAYASWAPQGQLTRSAEIGNQTWAARLAAWVYQPTTASLSLLVTGDVPEEDSERQNYRQILLESARRFKLP